MAAISRPKGQRLRSDFERAVYLRTVQDWIIRPQLQTVNGVAGVDAIGGYVKQYHVQPDPAKLIGLGMSFQDIAEALEKNNVSRGAGYVERNGEGYVVRSVGRLESMSDIDNAVIASRDGVPIHVRDVATVEIGRELRSGSASADGQEVVVGTALMLIGANSRTVSVAVDAKMQAIKRTLPPDIQVDTVLNRTLLVDATVRTVTVNLAEGALLVVLILFLLLGNFRAALITALVIPFSMLLTATGMLQGRISANLMSLGAIDFGLIVDGAVIIIIAATNRPDVLDPALLRPGRFDRQVIVPRPDIDGREQILAVHMKKVPLAPDVDPRVIARGTPGFSGADLANLVNEAALLAARRGKRLVAMKEFEEAKDKVMMGTERKSMVMTEDEKKMTAYHEAGHAVVALHEEASDPIHKATIIPRGRALGMVMRLPERDNYSYHRDKMYANLAVAMGGRVAEEVVFGYDKVSSGASSDIAYATGLARDMVTRWGMSDALGPLQYAEADEEVFLGYSVNRQKNMSNETAQAIDKEIRRIVEQGYDRAKPLLKEHRDELETLALALARI